MAGISSKYWLSKAWKGGLASSFGAGHFHGFFLSADTLPPIYFKFMVNTKEYIDDWDVEFAETRTPMTRAPRIEWVGNSTRKISFNFFWDNALAGASNCGPGKEDPTIFQHHKAPTAEIIISQMEQLRLPKSPLVRAVLSVGSIQPDFKFLTSPSPPKTILMLGRSKFVQGYVLKATPMNMKYNPAMIPIRVEFQVEFLVEPGTWIEKIEDIFRIFNNFAGLQAFYDFGRIF